VLVHRNSLRSVLLSHAGHLDRFLSISEVEMRMRDLVAGYPLKIGQLLEVGDSINVPDLAHRIRGLMAI
jgi:hypothetical protein